MYEQEEARERAAFSPRAVAAQRAARKAEKAARKAKAAAKAEGR